LIKGFGFHSIARIILKFADAHTLNGNWQKHGALGGSKGDGMVNILATRCWRLDDSFCRPNRPAIRCELSVGYAQNPSRHFV
jgi:hypothetical protein